MQSPSTKTVVFIFLVTTFLILLLLGFILVIVFFYRKRQQRTVVQMENLRANFEKELLTTRLEIQEQTFQYISQEIHDNIGQFISLAKLQLNTLDFEDSNGLREKAAHSVELLTKALDDLRDLSRSLSSDMVRNNGLAAAMELQVSQLQKPGVAEISYAVDGESRFLDEQKEIFILRIAQEAINNIIRHSQATRVDIRLEYRPDGLSMSISDNGKGFDQSVAKRKPSSGISNMRRRANMIGAQFIIQSKTGEGTLIRLYMPGV